MNYERDYSHHHCWDQKQPPACGIPLDKHTQCCLCDLGDTPTTPTTPKSCCEKCFGRQGTLAGGGTYCFYDFNGCCHSNSTQEEECPWAKFPKCPYHNHPAPQHTSFSDFFHNASPEEKERVMLEIAREATNDQREQIGLPPLHTSPEKEVDNNQMMHDLHEEIEHIQSAHSFTEKTLAEFRGNFVSKYTDPMFQEFDANEVEQWLSTKLEEAQKEHDECASELVDLADERFKEGKCSERTRILSLIESKKQECGSKCTEICDVLDWNAALTALAEELQNSHD